MQATYHNRKNHFEELRDAREIGLPMSVCVVVKKYFDALFKFECNGNVDPILEKIPHSLPLK